MRPINTFNEYTMEQSRKIALNPLKKQGFTYKEYINRNNPSPAFTYSDYINYKKLSYRYYYSLGISPSGMIFCQ